MRIDAVRFGVRTNKTIRKSGQKGATIQDIEKEILKQSNKTPQVMLYGDKLVKSANNFEKKNKQDRKRQLKQNKDTEYISEEEEYLEDIEQDQEIMVALY